MSQQSAKIQVTGNVGGNPVTRFNDKNTLIANFSVAVNDERRDRNGVVTKRTNWYNVTATGKQAEILSKNLRKGDPVQIDGKLSFNPWLDKQDNPQVAANVLCTDFTFMGRARNADGERNTDTEQTATPAQSENGNAAVPADIREALLEADLGEASEIGFDNVM
jgi:single-strand DNA-binding protein